jgi:hypothetical protein
LYSMNHQRDFTHYILCFFAKMPPLVGIVTKSQDR